MGDEVVQAGARFVRNGPVSQNLLFKDKHASLINPIPLFKVTGARSRPLP